MKTRAAIILFFVVFLTIDMSYAAGLIARIQQKKAQRQGPTEEEYREHMLEVQQEEANGGQPQGQQAQPTYQQIIDQRNQAIAQAIRDAHNASVQVPFGNGAEFNQAQPQTSNAIAVPAQQSGNSNTPPVDVQSVVDLAEVWKKLDKKSLVWTILIDDQSKLLTVSEYIGRFQKEGVKISAPPLHYVQEIDQLQTSNPQMLQRPFGDLLQLLAIVDYDFDNGMNKDDLARKVLGEEGYEANKKRFTQ